MRTPTERRGSEDGFSLIEVLVVIIIIGILAAIAVPLYLDQHAKAHDAAAKSDLTNLATYVIAAAAETNAVPTVTVAAGSYLVNGKEVVAATQGVVFGGISGTAPDAWCFDVTHPGGTYTASPGLRFTSDSGYAVGQCP